MRGVAIVERLGPGVERSGKADGSNTEEKAELVHDLRTILFIVDSAPSEVTARSDGRLRIGSVCCSKVGGTAGLWLQMLFDDPRVQSCWRSRRFSLLSLWTLT